MYYNAYRQGMVANLQRQRTALLLGLEAKDAWLHIRERDNEATYPPSSMYASAVELQGIPVLLMLFSTVRWGSCSFSGLSSFIPLASVNRRGGERCRASLSTASAPFHCLQELRRGCGTTWRESIEIEGLPLLT